MLLRLMDCDCARAAARADGAHRDASATSAGKTPDEMTVSWVTENPFAISEVSYGLSAHALDQKAVGRTTQYTMQVCTRTSRFL